MTDTMAEPLGTIGGWDIGLEAAVRADAAQYDQARYDAAEAIYDTADGAPDWVPIEASAVSMAAMRGARPGQSPGVVAEAGTLTAELYDPGRAYDPTASGYRSLLEPGAPVRLIARKEGVERPIWTGTASRWEHDTLTGEGSLEARDAVARIAAVPLADVARPAEPSPERVAALLNDHMSDAPPLTLTGVGRDVCAATMSGDLWQLLAAVVDTDQSWLWLDAAGALQWAGRALPEMVPALFLDAPDPAHPAAAVYTGLPVAVDTDTMVNEVVAARVSAPDGEPGERRHTEQPSRYRYDPHSYSNTALQFATDQEVDRWAADLLALRAYPQPRPLRLVVHVHQDLPWAAPTMDALLALDMGHPVRIRLTARGDAQEWMAVVAGVDHQSTPETWTSTIALALVQTVGRGGYDAPTSAYDRTTYDPDPLRELVPA